MHWGKERVNSNNSNNIIISRIMYLRLSPEEKGLMIHSRAIVGTVTDGVINSLSVARNSICALSVAEGVMQQDLAQTTLPQRDFRI